MKFLRLLLRLVFIAAALAALLALASFAPPVQTWFAQRALARQPGVHASLGEVAARFGTAEVTDLRLEFDGAVLTVPSLTANLPLLSALRTQKVVVKTLVAKGWTLDLSRRPDLAKATAQVVPIPAAREDPAGATPFPPSVGAPPELVRIVRGILSGWWLPWDVSLDGILMEGDVLIPVPWRRDPGKIHVILKGANIAAGREGVLDFDATHLSLDTKVQVINLAAHGRVLVVMQSPRTLKRVELKTDLSANGGSLPENLALSVAFVAARGADEETYSLEVNRGERQMASVLARFPSSESRMVGKWKMDLREADFAPFAPKVPLPSLAATGEGDMDADAAFTQLHALGHLDIIARRLGVFTRPLNNLGDVTLNTRFDFTHRGQSLRFDHLSVAAGAPELAGLVTSVQPFDFDERTGGIAVGDTDKDWLKVSLTALPLEWLSSFAGGIVFTGSKARGEFVVRAASGGFALREVTPLIANGVTLKYAGQTIGPGLDLSFSLRGERKAQGGWQMEWAPLSVSASGHNLATIEGKMSRPAEASQPLAITGKWKTDLAALASVAAVPDLRWITARSASGDFSASVGPSTTVGGNLAVLGPDANHSVNVTNARASIRTDGTGTFRAPVKISLGAKVSDLSVDGTWSTGRAGRSIDLALSSKDTSVEHLRQLASPLAAMGGAHLIASASGAPGGTLVPARIRDRSRFWGNWIGRASYAFGRLNLGDEEIEDVRGSVGVAPGSLSLEKGFYGRSNYGLGTLKGSISFDPAAETPYRLEADFGAAEVEASTLFGAPSPGQEPLVKGRFSVARTMTGNGIALDDLIGRTQQEFRLSSPKGIVRLLRTNVADAFQEPSTPVTDALNSVGSLVRPLFGAKPGAIGSGVRRVSKSTDAVLGFTYHVAEIGYDKVTLTAVQGPDGTIRLVDFAMTSKDERLTASGRIDTVKGSPLAAASLSVDLLYGARGQIAELLATAGLLSARKDEEGYTMLNQAIHFGGTLGHIDGSEWHDFLAKAVTRNPDDGRKDGAKAAGKK